jgi:tetratricopeptide (TPR) repeat protein
MNELGQPRDAATAELPAHDDAVRGLSKRDLVMRFESLGGSGHGCEFGLFQRHFGAEPLGLLRWADLAPRLLMEALESGFEGVGLPENTVVFSPEGSDEWWTKDTRYWMAMRSFVKTADVSLDQMTAKICQRLQFLRLKLIEDLKAGEKIFTFKCMQRNLTDPEVARLHAAVRSYGESTLFYVRYADEAHPAGTVELTGNGLLIGYIDHFAFSPDDKHLGPVNDAWFDLCERAYRAYQGVTVQAMASPALPSSNKRIVPRPARRIVLIGNCQINAMGQLYRRFAAGRTGDTVEHIPTYQDLSEKHRIAIEQADVVVEQLFDLKQQADTTALPTTTPRLFIPMVTAAFLWPFAGSPHPKNTGYPFLPTGPYDGEAADSYLNRMIAAGTDPEEAVEAYANLDVNKRVNLDRLFELVMDRQRARDAAAGYQIADIMEQHFRTEQIFLSPYHPNVRIATALATQLFEQLGAERKDIELMRHCTRVTPFPKGELPFHPGVCRHFGLDFVAPDRRYRFRNEGFFTFREFALRYMRYEWNEALEEGMHLAHTGKTEEARLRLVVALKRSPLSAAGHNSFSHIHNRQGARDDAVASARRAVEIEPGSASYIVHLGEMLRQIGEGDAALEAVRSAVIIDPVEPHHHFLLAHLLRQRGELTAAREHLQEAVNLDPYSAKFQAELAEFTEAKGDSESALDAVLAAIALAPDDLDIRYRLIRLLGRMNRLQEAVDAARSAAALAPDSARAHTVLSDLLLRQDKRGQALTEAYLAAVCEPTSVHAYAHLGHVLRVTDDLPAAEAAFRRAAELDPLSAHIMHEMSVLLNQQQRLDQAVAAARKATELEPSNPHRFMHLTGLLTRQDDIAGALNSQRQAVSLQPDDLKFRVVLSDLFARQGRLDEALTEARIAAEHHPGSVRALCHLAHVTQMTGDFERAEGLLRTAIGFEPHNEKLQSDLAFLGNRRRGLHAA